MEDEEKWIKEKEQIVNNGEIGNEINKIKIIM
jgi:hypothetical protein